MIYPQNFEEKIGFDKVRNLLKNACLSTLGKDKVLEMQFITNFETIQVSLTQVEEFKHILVYESNFPSNYFIDARPALKRIRLEGTFISQTELFDLSRSLATIRDMVRFFKSENSERYVELRKLFADLNAFEPVIREMNRLLDDNGNIKDSASPELGVIRREISQKVAAISRISKKMLDKAKSEGWVEDDAQITVRDGKMLIPVSASYKRKINGFIYDESATGKTSYIEPAEAVEANNKLRELELAEKREIVKILTIFTENIRPQVPELMNAYETLAEIDFIRAKAVFALQIAAEMPNLSRLPEIDMRTAKHPLLLLSFKKENRKVVPLDIELNQEQKIILISGPNAGGKSVCLKTVGLLQYMHQHGLQVSANRTSTLGVFHDIFIDIGDEQSIENDLSTYSSHLKNMKFFSEKCTKNSLLLIDEFGTGTEPMVGAAIAEAVLEQFLKYDARGVITTHYTNLKNFAADQKGIVNGAMLFNREELQPLFQLVTGKPGSSFAFEIAGKIGLAQVILSSAEKKVGSKHLDFEKQLQDIEKEKLELQNQLRKTAQLEKKLETEIARNEYETEFSLKNRKNILEETKKEAAELLAKVNKQIENTIYEVKQHAANKDKTKEIRSVLENFKQEIFQQQNNEEATIDRRLEQILRRRERKREKKLTEEVGGIQEVMVDNTIYVGDAVLLKKSKAIAEVLEIKGDRLIVAIGGMRAEVAIKEAEKTSKNKIKRTIAEKAKPEIKTTDTKMAELKSNFSTGLDVRGKRAEEALDRVERFIDEAIVVSASELRILHGTGNGILRKLIREQLLAHPIVKSVVDEKVEFGGAGISIVTLDY